MSDITTDGPGSFSMSLQVAQARNMSIGETSALLRNIRNISICVRKKPIFSVTYENERISIKNSLPYITHVLRLSCVVHEPFYGFLCKRFSPYVTHILYKVTFSQVH